jgi:hypothetical protein
VPDLQAAIAAGQDLCGLTIGIPVGAYVAELPERTREAWQQVWARRVGQAV